MKFGGRRAIMRVAVPVALFTAMVVFWNFPTQAAGIADHDSTLPIDIEADSLKVEQENERATFAGNVDVKQGDMVLKSDRLTVFYALGGEGGAATQAIRRIEAAGNVLILSPEETAQGDEGIYDLSTSSIALNGNVVLTQGENVIRGSKLDIDMTTKTATVSAGEGETKGRVRALFLPATQ